MYDGVGWRLKCLRLRRKYESNKVLIALLRMKKLPSSSVRKLVRLIKNDDVLKIKALVEKGISLDQEVKFDSMMPARTLLDYACEVGARRVVAILVELGAELNAGRHSKPLITAVLFGRAQIAELLIKAGADPNVTIATVVSPSKRDRGYTALMTAASLPDKPDMLDLLLKSGANPHLATQMGRSALSVAVDHGNRHAVHALLKMGCRASGHELHLPAYRGDVEMVRSLIQAGADVNVERRREYGLADLSPLETAIDRRGSNIVDDGIWKNEKSRWAAENRKREAEENERYSIVIKDMIKAGADLNRITVDESPVYRAAKSGDLEIVKLLLNAGANPNAISQVPWKKIYQETALHRAAREGFLEVAQALVKAGAKIDTKDRNGHTPSDLAQKNGHLEVSRFLAQV